MELKVSREITGKWQNQRSETNKYVSWAVFFKLQAAGINCEKLLGCTVFKNPNFNPFNSIFFSCAHLWHLLFLLCYFNLPLKFLSGYFYVSLNLAGFLQFPNLAELSATAPLAGDPGFQTLFMRSFWFRSSVFGTRAFLPLVTSAKSSGAEIHTYVHTYTLFMLEIYRVAGCRADVFEKIS